ALKRAVERSYGRGLARTQERRRMTLAWPLRGGPGLRGGTRAFGPPLPVQTLRSCLLVFLLRLVQRAVFCRRRCSLAFINSFMSAAGRISKTLPYFRAGCCVMSCTA